jgi:hypothetical protein
MKNVFLTTTAAAALLAGIGFASAQGTYEQKTPAASEQKAAPELDKSKEMNKSKGSEQKAQEKPALNAQAPAKAGAKSETTGQAEPAKSQDTKAQDTKQDSTKSQSTQSKSGSEMQNAQSPAKGTAAQSDTKTGTSTSSDTKAGTSTSSSTTNTNVSASVNLNPEQKTKIRETVIKSSNAPRVANVNFSVSIGTTVPKTVRFAPLPSYLVEIQPAWRGYEYFLVGDEIVVVDPRTLRIVAILQV